LYAPTTEPGWKKAAAGFGVFSFLFVRAAPQWQDKKWTARGVRVDGRRFLLPLFLSFLPKWNGNMVREGVRSDVPLVWM